MERSFVERAVGDDQPERVPLAAGQIEDFQACTNVTPLRDVLSTEAVYHTPYGAFVRRSERWERVI